MLLAGLYDLVRDLNLLVMIDHDPRIRCASATLPWLLMVFPLLYRVQRKADDVG